MNKNEDCGGCLTRSGSAGYEWHRSHEQPPCDKARADHIQYGRDRSKRRAEAQGRVYVPKTPGRSARQPRWTPGTSIFVPEVDPL